MPSEFDVMPDGESPRTVTFTNLDEPLFGDAGATKRDLVAYLERVAPQLVAELSDRPLSVVRALRDQPPFMQKNVPRYAPSWLRTVTLWAESSHREVSYALCNDRESLLWFANQRAVEYHPALVRVDRPRMPTHLVIDLDPPSTEGFALAVQAAHLARETLDEVGLQGAVKTSGAKGMHVFVPLLESTFDDVAAAARAVAARAERRDPSLATTAFMKQDRGGRVFVDATRVGWATVVAAYSPRLRPGVPVSFPVSWEDLDGVSPLDFTVHSVPAMLADRDPWVALMPKAQALPAALIEEGRGIPAGRVQAMHEGRRRARQARGDKTGEG